MQALVDTGIDDQTIVLFTSDNGATVGERIGSNAPLRGGKASTWEGGFRVPLIARWPGHIPQAVVSDELATSMDLLPTIAQWTGGELPAHTLDGMNVGDLFLNPVTSRSPRTEMLYYARDGGLEAIRVGKWKLHVAKTRVWPADVPFLVSLYDLENDISEEHNVASYHPDIVEQLTQRMWVRDAVLTAGMRPVARK